MSDEANPPREWWINTFSNVVFKDEPGGWLKVDRQVVNVIEMSAYDKVKAECERLEVWKKEMELLTAGVFAFEHPEMQLGDRKFETVLKFAKERDSLAAQLAEFRRMYDDAARAAHVRIARLEKALSTHSSTDIACLLELVKLYELELQGYASLPDGGYYGPNDIYTNLGQGAREALTQGRKIKGE